MFDPPSTHQFYGIVVEWLRQRTFNTYYECSIHSGPTMARSSKGRMPDFQSEDAVSRSARATKACSRSSVGQSARLRNVRPEVRTFPRVPILGDIDLRVSHSTVTAKFGAQLSVSPPIYNKIMRHYLSDMLPDPTSLCLKCQRGIFPKLQINAWNGYLKGCDCAKPDSCKPENVKVVDGKWIRKKKL